MVKIRLKRVGKKRKPFYHVVVADARTARDGKIIEKIGTYDPMTQPSTINVDLEKVATWIKNGAQPTETAKKLIEIAKKDNK
ncbi:MAG: 30S ribosomal protein S16 [Clostridium sp.]